MWSCEPLNLFGLRPPQIHLALVGEAMRSYPGIALIVGD